MASNITLSYFGPPEQKCVCKVPPMQTLAEAVQTVSSKFKPALAAGSYELQLNKKAVDLNTPFRLLNVPAGSKLEVIRRVAASHASAAPQQAAPDIQGAATASAEPQGREPAEQQQQQQWQQQSEAALPGMQAPALQSAGTVMVPAAATAARSVPPNAGATGTSTDTSTQQPPASDTTSSGAPLATPAAADGAVLAAAVDDAAASGRSAAAGAGDLASTSTSPLAALGVSGPVYVFHQRSLEAAAASASSAMEVDPPDEFFEMTLEDLARLQQQAAAKKKQESTFRTQAVRDAEAAARASSLGPVRVRLHFPDGTLLQAAFGAMDPLDKVLELLRKVAAPDVAAALYLYTTPPKIVLKDTSATLYQLQLIPAAHIYVGCDEKKLGGKSSSSSGGAGGIGPTQGATGSCSSLGAASWLRPEVLALMQDSVPQPAATTAADGDDPPGVGGSSGDKQAAAAAAATEAQRALRLAAAAGRQAGGSSVAGGSGDPGKVPKWMKMGKK